MLSSLYAAAKDCLVLAIAGVKQVAKINPILDEIKDHVVPILPF